jgi:calcineurin-like phosphoesterase family protein
MKQRINRFFTSDLHFFHKNVIQFCDRPYEDVYQMQEGMIKIWNATVPPDGVVYILGDFGFISVEEGRRVLSRLNGTKHLIRGNHDYGIGKMEHMGFAFVAEKVQIELEGNLLLLSHFPYKKLWLKNRPRYADLHPTRGTEDWLLHGHVHNNWPKVNSKSKMINVCWDVWNRPVSMSEITSIIVKEKKCTTTNLLKRLLDGLVCRKRKIMMDFKYKFFRSM